MRNCSNCKHIDTWSIHEPCWSCSPELDMANWEPREERKRTVNKYCCTCLYYGGDTVECNNCTAKSNWEYVGTGVLIIQGIIVITIIGISVWLWAF